MKTHLLLLTLFASIFVSQMQAQDRTTVNAMNSEISDNLDLRAVASIFGDSRNLQDFERRLNDPKSQISNLDLNNDYKVDYLRVIETVENRTHLIIIQSVLGRDSYQDVATIDVEKDRYNNIHVQVIGDVYMYGQNYIYEPVYFNTPQIYASFWLSSYRPYYSTWSWNFYPTYYFAWNPYPVYRYRNNVQLCLNVQTNYNYVNYRRSNRAMVLYNTRRCNSYERQHPNYAFSRRNSEVTNRYELDQRRVSRNENGYSKNRTNSSREVASQKTGAQRDYSQNRVNSSREVASQKTGAQRDYSQNRVNSSREVATQKTEPQRDYSQNRVNSSREVTTQKTQPQRDYSQNRVNSSRETATQRTQPQKDYSQNRANPSRETTTQRTEPQRDYSQNRGNSSRETATQRTEPQRENSSNSRNNNRRT